MHDPGDDVDFASVADVTEARVGLRDPRRRVSLLCGPGGVGKPRLVKGLADLLRMSRAVLSGVMWVSWWGLGTYWS